MRFVKEKTSKSTLMHVAAEATTVNVAEEIKWRLKHWIELETPMLLDDFEKKLVESLTQPILAKRPCNTVKVKWDEEPFVDKWKNLDEDVVYAKTHEVNVIVCDGKKYAVESENEYYYYIPSGDILHSFKLIDVREVKEE